MKMVGLRFLKENRFVSLGVVAVVWIIIAGVIMSTVRITQYDKRSSMSPDRFSPGFNGIQMQESENQTVENLSYPMLFEDNSTMSVVMPEGKNRWHDVRHGKEYGLRVSNESGKNLSRSKGSSSNGKIGISGGGATLEREEECLFEFTGIHIIMFFNDSVTQHLKKEFEYSGSIKGTFTNFRFFPPDQRGENLDYTILSVDMGDTHFNITVLDQYYNILVQESNVAGSTSFEYNALNNEYNYVIVEAEDEESKIDIAVDQKKISNKYEDYVKIVVVISLTVLVTIAVGYTIIGESKNQLL
jgi:hypothetical protein